MIGRLKDAWGNLIQASQNILQADRVALRPTKKDTLDLTSARVFLDDTQYQQRVVNLLKEYYPNGRAPNGAIKVYTVMHTMLLALTQLHTLWRRKVYLSDVQVEEAERWAKKLGVFWKLRGGRQRYGCIGRCAMVNGLCGSTARWTFLVRWERSRWRPARTISRRSKPRSMTKGAFLQSKRKASKQNILSISAVSLGI